MERQARRGARNWSGSGRHRYGKASGWSLRDRFGATEFLGYDTERAEGAILALVKDNAEVERARRR
jgi:alanyl-tRNA synthetase